MQSFLAGMLIVALFAASAIHYLTNIFEIAEKMKNGDLSEEDIWQIL